MCRIQIPEGATLDEKRSLCFDALYDMNLGDKVEKKDISHMERGLESLQGDLSVCYIPCCT